MAKSNRNLNLQLEREKTRVRQIFNEIETLEMLLDPSKSSPTKVKRSPSKHGEKNTEESSVNEVVGLRRQLKKSDAKVINSLVYTSLWNQTEQRLLHLGFASPSR